MSQLPRRGSTRRTRPTTARRRAGAVPPSALLGLLLPTLAAGCTLLAEPEAAPAPRCQLRLQDGGPGEEPAWRDPCPPGLRCRGGRCLPCDPASPERCGDGRDDDCDGRVDEGTDVDGDGFATCAAADGAAVDCDDDDATAVPGGVETCDGRDDDCDGRIDEASLGPPLCPADAPRCADRRCVDPRDCRVTPCERPGDRCAPGADGSAFRCTDMPPACEAGPPSSCPPEAPVCDPGGSGNCLVDGARPPGSPCIADVECAPPGRCAPVVVLPGLPDGAVPGLTAGRCLVPCRSDAACGPGEVCWSDPGSGARGCVLAAVAGVAGVGTGEAGADCSGGGGACRSGLCAADEVDDDDGGLMDGGPAPPDAGGPRSPRCLGRCVASTDCPSGWTCRHAPSAAEGVIGLCVEEAGEGGAPRGTACRHATDCASRLCLRIDASQARCADLCGTAGDCPVEEDRCVTLPQGPAGGLVSVCRPAASTVPGAAAGEACLADPDCRSGGCVDGICRRRCADRTDCPEGEACTYLPLAGRWAAFCRPE
jgi:hypothetical protein